MTSGSIPSMEFDSAAAGAQGRHAASQSAPSLAEAIKELIYNGEFAPGQRLSEASLALRMGTGRGPIREAFKLLTGWGLLTSVPNKGVSVRKMSVREMLEVYELRAVLFSFAAERAAQRITEADKRDFSALIDAMSDACAREDGTGYYELNLRFHARIMDLSGNRRARQAYEDYVKELHLFRRRYFNERGNMRHSNEQHRSLFEAICEGSVARAREIAEQHVMEGRQRLLLALDDMS